MNKIGVEEGKRGRWGGSAYVLCKYNIVNNLIF